MDVRQLISQLQRFDPDTRVFSEIVDDFGNTEHLELTETEERPVGVFDKIHGKLKYVHITGIVLKSES